MKKWAYATRTALVLFALWIFFKVGFNWALAMGVGFELGKLACVP